MGIFAYTHRRTFVIMLLIAAVAALCSVPQVSAQQSSSSHYQVNESFFGTGGSLDAASSQYKAKQSAGELAVGQMRSTLYSGQAGFNTDRTPYLAIATLTTSVDIGVLDSSHANVGTAQFWVRAYLSDGYVVRSYGGPPTNGTHSLSTSGTAFTSTPGDEQFGMNLAVNSIAGAMTGTPLTAMTNFGAAPTQYPNYPADPFGFGQADADYTTANQFRYIDGDQIAYSTQSSSDTTYTMSYLYNMSGVTPAGTYTMYHIIVATATF